MSPELLVLAILGGICVWGLLLWMGLRALFAKLSGWNRLAARYRAAGAEPSWQWRGQTVKVGLVRYRRTIRLAAAAEGLHLAETGLLRHPALCIPWCEMTRARPSSFYGRPSVEGRWGCRPSAQSSSTRRSSTRSIWRRRVTFTVPKEVSAAFPAHL